MTSFTFHRLMASFLTSSRRPYARGRRGMRAKDHLRGLTSAPAGVTCDGRCWKRRHGTIEDVSAGRAARRWCRPGGGRRPRCPWRRSAPGCGWRRPVGYRPVRCGPCRRGGRRSGHAAGARTRPPGRRSGHGRGARRAGPGCLAGARGPSLARGHRQAAFGRSGPGAGGPVGAGQACWWSATGERSGPRDPPGQPPARQPARWRVRRPHR